MPQKPQRKLSAALASPSAPLPMPPSSTTKPKSFAEISSTYASRFNTSSSKSKSRAKFNQETDEERQQRIESAADGADQYYDFATEAYLSGWGEHFHYCPFSPTDTIKSAMTFYEHRLALLMNLRPGMKVLDVGCGVGGPAREIAKFIGCTIIGITINQRQVNRAIEMTARAGLSEQCTFVKGDFLDLPFEDESFDAAYAIEATVYAPDLGELYKGVSRVLKPGAVFGLSEWVMTEGYDEGRERHREIKEGIERGNGISNLVSTREARGAMLGAGFVLSHDEDFAEHWNVKEQAKVYPYSRVGVPGKGGERLAPPPSWEIDAEQAVFRPWYWALVGDHKKATTWEDWWIAVRMTKKVRKLCYYIVWFLELLRIYPKGVIEAMTVMAFCVDSVADGGKEKCFSPCWWFIGRKAGRPRELAFEAHGNEEAKMNRIGGGNAEGFDSKAAQLS